MFLSLSVHGALGWAVLRAPAGMFGDPRQVEPLAIEIVETMPDPERPPAEEDEPLPLPPQPPTPEDSPSPPDQVAATLAPRLGLPSPVEPGDPVEGNPNPNTEAAVPSSIDVPDITPDEPHRVDTSDRRAMQALLNPSAVAAGGYTPTGPGPSQRGAPAGLATADTERPSEQDLERQHSGHLRAQAMARPWLTRTEPDLERRADGSLAYAGHRFEAIINPDGSVVFNDRGNAQTNGFSASGSFDLTDALMGAAGQDPHAAERDWFMRRTREVRHRLEAAHRSQQAQRGLVRLRGRLARIWRTTTRSTAARRRRIFTMWDETSEDELGRRARAVVIAFIQDTIPAGSEEAYTESEIASLNARRENTERFAPY